MKLFCVKVKKKRGANVDVWRISILKVKTVKEPDSRAEKTKNRIFFISCHKIKEKIFYLFRKDHMSLH